MTYTEKTTSKRITREEKELLQRKTNQESLAAAIDTLENINANYSYKVNRNSKSRIHELLVLLKHNDQKISLSIRVANAISILDSMSQDRRIESHIRTMLWQVVSNLEGIRE
ncbi:MAG: UPF0147 family protein [Candidatus Nitrosopolaris sp.]